MYIFSITYMETDNTILQIHWCFQSCCVSSCASRKSEESDRKAMAVAKELTESLASAIVLWCDRGFMGTWP